MRWWLPLLCVAVVAIPCDGGHIHVDVPAVLLESFYRLTKRPSPWPLHLGGYIEYVFALVVVTRERFILE